MKGILTEKGLRTFILLAITKKYEPGTKSNMDYIYKASTRTKIDYICKALSEKYESGEAYDVSDLYTTVRDFAMNSTHHPKYCLEKVSQMHFKSDTATVS